MLYYIVVITILFVLICFLICKKSESTYESYDNIYDSIYLMNGKVNAPLLKNANKLPVNINKNNKILIITYDNRPNLNYVKIHNENVKKYCNKWKCDYIYYDKCKHNTYWCKLYMIYDNLLNNKYDYVMWMDSDSVFRNMDISLNDIVNSYSSDLIMTNDYFVTIPKFNSTNKKWEDISINDTDNALGNKSITEDVIYGDRINAGIFIIKNSDIGRQFIKDCLDHHENTNELCVNGNLLEGDWAGYCYEQGAMNMFISKIYDKYTTVLPIDIVYNNEECRNDVFISHLYASSSEKREKCFSSNKFDKLLTNREMNVKK